MTAVVVGRCGFGMDEDQMSYVECMYGWMDGWMDGVLYMLCYILMNSWSMLDAIKQPPHAPHCPEHLHFTPSTPYTDSWRPKSLPS